jgi:putative phosphotransacetylase
VLIFRKIMGKIPIEVSARHVHISQNDLEKLFGKGYKLKKKKQLSQPSDFAAKETLDIQNGLKKISNLRIVGPPRKKTQVELSATDAIRLGIKPVLKESGNVKKTPGIFLISPKKKIRIKEGVIVALRHIHCSPKEVRELGFKY